MSPNRPKPSIEIHKPSLYIAGATAALLVVLISLADVAISFAGGDNVPGMPVTEWFALYAENAFIGMRNLGLFNLIINTLSVVLFLALFTAHRRSQPVAAALALSVMVLGAGVYAANNQALPMLALSEQYAAAEGAARQEMLATGAALLERGEDFTPGAYPGFFLCLLANILMAAVLLRGKLFRKWIALTGLAAAAIMLAFTTLTTFQLATVEAMMPLALVGGLCLWIWNVSVALRLFRLARPTVAQTTIQPSGVRMAGEGAH